MVRWMASLVGDMGVDLFPEFAAARVLVENDCVVGIRVGDKGIDKAGKPKPNYEPGVDVRAKMVILSEGPRGTLTKQLSQIFNLEAGKNPQTYAIGIKELWQLPDDRYAPGTVIHTLGWPLDTDTFGGAFIYGMKDRISTSVSSSVSTTRIRRSTRTKEFQRLKLHPSIRSILGGGKMIAAGAKAIPEGGYFSMPRLSGQGFMILGDSAGCLNGARLKGIHLAIKSGILAAETAFHALLSEDYSATQLAEYDALFEQLMGARRAVAATQFSSGIRIWSDRRSSQRRSRLRDARQGIWSGQSTPAEPGHKGWFGCSAIRDGRPHPPRDEV